MLFRCLAQNLTATQKKTLTVCILFSKVCGSHYKLYHFFWVLWILFFSSVLVFVFLIYWITCKHICELPCCLLIWFTMLEFCQNSSWTRLSGLHLSLYLRNSLNCQTPILHYVCTIMNIIYQADQQACFLIWVKAVNLVTEVH